MSQLVLEIDEPSMPGHLVTVAGILPEDMNAFRPANFEFVDADDWQIFEFTIHGTQQLTRQNVIATEFASAIRDGGCHTIQRRMTFAMKVIYQGSKGVPFRCVITGTGV